MSTISRTDMLKNNRLIIKVIKNTLGGNLTEMMPKDLLIRPKNKKLNSKHQVQSIKDYMTNLNPLKPGFRK